MTYQHDGRALRRRNLAVRFLLGASASTAFIWGSVPLPVSADPKPTQNDATDHVHYGNGTHNNNIFSAKSPTHTHGYQNTDASTAGGATSIQNAMCRNVKVCNIIQKVTLPRKAKTATQNKTDTSTPQNSYLLIPKKDDVPTSGEVKTDTPKNFNPPPPDTGSLLHLELGFMVPVSASAISPFTGGCAVSDTGERAVRLSAHVGRRPM
jgi:hypothetical protein